MKKNLLLLGMLFISSLCLAQVSKQNAIEIVMDSIVGSDTANVNVYMEPLLQSNTYYVMSPFDSIQSPYANYWLFFIDDMPSYMWCHACRYVFVDATNGSLLSVSKQKPSTHWPSSYEAISNSDEILSAPNYGNNYHVVTPVADDENTKHLLETLPRRDAPMTIVKRNHPTVSNLSTEIMENNEVLLTWNYPEGNLSEMTLSWSNMDMVDCFGFQAAQCATDQVQRFDTMDLRNLDGWKIEDVTVILSPYDSVLISPYDTTYPPLGNYLIRIWKGDDTDLTMVYEQLIENPVFGRPLTVTLDSDVLIDANSELRVGYYLDQYTRYTWAFDSQSSTYEGKSALIQVYSNQSECNPNYWHFNHYYNLCISSTLTNPNGQGVAEGLTGYRVYRNGDLIATIPFAFQTYYIDAELTRNFDVEYCVTAVYGDEESEPVCATVSITGIGEKLENDNVVTLSPNPTNGIVYIDGMVASEIKVYNALGQLAKAFNDTNEIDLKDLKQGVYLLRITDGNGVIVTKKIVVE